MGLTHLGAIMKLKVNPLFSGCDDLLICQCCSVDVACVTINCTHVVYQITATPSYTNGVRPICGRPWYPPVWMPALTLINQNCNCSAVFCLLWCLRLLEPLMEADQPTKWPSVRIFTTITVVTPWMRSPLFQSTMADPVIVMLVTFIMSVLWYGLWRK